MGKVRVLISGTEGVNSWTPPLSSALLERCPSCGRLFAGKLLKKELADIKEHHSQKLRLIFTNKHHYKCKHLRARVV